ncbi:MAG: PQQ-binding-like beta-propeller repeat protein [Planctomycetota bacterium]
MSLSRRECLSGLAGLAVAGAASGRADAAASSSAGWPQWRGPNGNNIAVAGTVTPTTLDASRVKWRTSVPGRGHSSPVIVGDAIYLTTADEANQTQSVVAVGLDGRARWSRLVHRGGFARRIHPNNTHASPTVASDGKSLFAVFNNGGSVTLSSFGLDGTARWQKTLGPFVPQRYEFGYGPSPIVHDGKVIVAAECDTGAFITARDVATGGEVWRIKRPSDITFSSPIVTTIAGREQMLISGNHMVASYDPATGTELWSVDATTQATCGTMVWDGDLVFASGGYPSPGTYCVRADGSKEIVWQNNQKCYEQSMLAVGGYVYAVPDSGVAHCWRAADGETMWRERLGGRGWSSSPLLVGDTITVLNERGEAFVFKATPDDFVGLAKTKVADEAFASPVAVGDTMYLRVANGAGSSRQEELIAFA